MYKNTTKQIFIQEPFPEIINLNIGWDQINNSYSDILNFSVSIPLKMRPDEIFNIKNQSYESSRRDTGYILRGVVCFIGAHYMTYLKQLNNNGFIEWRLYNDSSQVQRYRGWIDILNQVMELGQQPTLLIYEKLTPKNMQYDRNE